MIRTISGLNSRQNAPADELNGFFLVQIESASYRWHPQKPFLTVRFAILEPATHKNRTFYGRIYCSERALWRLTWLLRDFGYDLELLDRDQIDEKALLQLRGVVRTSATRLRGRCYQNLDGFAPASEWDTIPRDPECDFPTKGGRL